MPGSTWKAGSCRAVPVSYTALLIAQGDVEDTRVRDGPAQPCSTADAETEGEPGSITAVSPGRSGLETRPPRALTCRSTGVGKCPRGDSGTRSRAGSRGSGTASRAAAPAGPAAAAVEWGTATS